MNERRERVVAKKVMESCLGLGIVFGIRARHDLMVILMLLRAEPVKVILFQDKIGSLSDRVAERGRPFVLELPDFAARDRTSDFKRRHAFNVHSEALEGGIRGIDRVRQIKIETANDERKQVGDNLELLRKAAIERLDAAKIRNGKGEHFLRDREEVTGNE